MEIKGKRDTGKKRSVRGMNKKQGEERKTGMQKEEEGNRKIRRKEEDGKVIRGKQMQKRDR